MTQILNNMRVFCAAMFVLACAGITRAGVRETTKARREREDRAVVRLGDQGSVAGASICTQPAQNCQAFDNFNALGSSRAFDLVADDFVAVGSSVSSVCWWGAYAFDPGTGLQDCASPGAGDTFEIRYYADNGGLPGALLATFSQGSVTTPLTVTGPVATGGMIADVFSQYSLTATHTPVPLTPGTRYWISISNIPPSCEWFWETAQDGNVHAVQDGRGGLAVNGFDAGDVIDQDLAFCTDAGFPRPANDACANATPITGSGEFPFDNANATTDGLSHAGCILSPTPQIAHDQWYCWTAPFTDRAVVRTCDRTDDPNTDTVIAVYDGCSTCPPDDTVLISCNDDRCVDFNTLALRLQSMVAFDAQSGHQYLIRVGNFVDGQRGSGVIEVSSPPPAQANCPGAGDCCTDTQTPACSDDTCCRTVCACDPFCCEIDWDQQCAARGYTEPGTGIVSQCGAQLLCEANCVTCGESISGDCCSANGSPSCMDLDCCEAVCARDPYCCDVEWDSNCVENNARVSGADAATLCPALCNCGDPQAGDCCDPNGSASPGCSDATCCSAVCATDGFCCDNVWDSNCVVGFDSARPGAFVLCEDLCACPNNCGDIDGDASVTLRDLATFYDCFAPVPQPWQSCKCADLDLNGSVNLADYSILVDVLQNGSTHRPPHCP